jgi:hypothetical protein
VICIDASILIVFIVRHTINTFLFIPWCCALFKFVFSCAQGARLFASLFTEVMVGSAALKAPVHRYIASMLPIIHPIFSLFCDISLQVCGASSITRFLAFVLVLMMKFVMPPFFSASSVLRTCNFFSIF